MIEKYDFHAHIFTTWEDESKWRIERAPRTPDYILGSIKEADMNGIGLVNFADNKYERFRDSVINPKPGGMENWRLERDLGCVLALIDKRDEYPIKIIKVEELNAKNKGHMLIIGANAGEKIGSGRTIEEICGQADRFRALKLPSHPGKMYGMSKKELIESADRYDAYESSNGNYDKLDEKDIKDIFEKTGLNGISTSDSHNRKNIGNGYIAVHRKIDFSSADNFRDSLREIFSTGDFMPVRKRKNPLFSRISHGLLTAYDFFVLYDDPWKEKIRLIR